MADVSSASAVTSAANIGKKATKAVQGDPKSPELTATDLNYYPSPYNVSPTSSPIYQLSNTR